MLIGLQLNGVCNTTAGSMEGIIAPWMVQSPWRCTQPVKACQ
uniref:Uncharacterized protein n=1 Tax=Anguilla anguilla TaxID=7936 RepID=A0A0E9SDU3_ANGAN